MSWPEWRRLNPDTRRRSEEAKNTKIALRWQAHVAKLKGSGGKGSESERESGGASASGGAESSRRPAHRRPGFECSGCRDNEYKAGCTFMLCGVCCKRDHGDEYCSKHRPFLQ